LGTIFLLNAAALYIFPVLGHLLHLSLDPFGPWSGIAIHDISSLVGVASHFGTASLNTATAIRLSRALWIVPISLFFVVLFQDRSRVDRTASQKIQIPWFIRLCLHASIIRTLIPTVAYRLPFLTQFSEAGLKLTLFLIRAGLSIQARKTVGWQPIAREVVL
jgi:uncharacterized membrane protein YadS